MILSLHPQYAQDGTLAQMVEQWTENPCVPGSIPGGTTKTRIFLFGFFVFILFCFFKPQRTQRFTQGSQSFFKLCEPCVFFLACIAVKK